MRPVESDGDLKERRGAVPSRTDVLPPRLSAPAPPAPFGHLPGMALDRKLMPRLGAEACLHLRVLPWRRMGGAVILLSEVPDLAPQARALLRSLYGELRLFSVEKGEIGRLILTHFARDLVARAETLCPEAASCRAPTARPLRVLLGALLLAAGLVAWVGPVAVGRGVLLWSLLWLLALTALRAAALVPRRRPVPPPRLKDRDLPAITMLVPLFRETAITDHLLAHLAGLDYPRNRLQILLICEAEDVETLSSLAGVDLPEGVELLTVPDGCIRTKPRALNYALPFATGDILGIWDAEDAPEADQLRVVAAAFAAASPDVACLQGQLDFYNSRATWLTRCFTLEYASWFRVILPALERLNWVLPLGGTTLFLRRDALNAVGGWDAHNVTEDAELGLRLARAGYRTRMIPTTTFEEANGLAWPWVRQRSRWLKGFALTYAAHMRSPRELWRDLGGRGFLSVQVIFLGTLTQVLVAPLFWALWLLPWLDGATGAPVLNAGMLQLTVTIFLASELVALAVYAAGLKPAGKLGLLVWAVTMPLYYLLAVVAGYKAMWEILTRPYYWDKTAHGILPPDRVSRSARVWPRRASAG